MAAVKHLSGIDLVKNELQNARIHQLASAPGTPVSGQIYYNTTDNTLYWWNGTTWVAAKDSGATTLYYQTIKDDGTARTQRANLNFVSTTSVALTATDDSGNDETEITADVQYGSVTAQTSFGASSGNGAANTAARSDHTHGTPAHDAAAHSAIRLNNLQAANADYSMGGFKLTSLGTPTADTDAATKLYVDSVARGLDWKDSVRVATTAAGTLASGFENGDTIDGVVLATGNRILIKNQATASENGIYTVNTSGAPTRAVDADANAEVTAGLAVFVSEGTTNGNTAWVLTTDDPITVGSTNLTFSQFGGGETILGGNGLTKTGSTLDVGPGTGITVAADSVSIDTSVVVRKYAVDIGDNTSTTITVTHNLNTKDITWSVRQTADDVFVEVDGDANTVNTLVLTFATAPATNALRAVVHG